MMSDAWLCILFLVLWELTSVRRQEATLQSCSTALAHAYAYTEPAAMEEVFLLDSRSKRRRKCVRRASMHM
jgi:hypothetical protein